MQLEQPLTLALSMFSMLALAACDDGGATSDGGSGSDSGSSADAGSTADAGSAGDAGSTDAGSADAGSTADGGSSDPAVVACQEAADAYLEACESVETDSGRLCEIRTFREVCAMGRADAVRATYECLLASRTAGGVCATFTDLATDEVRACAWTGIGTSSASATAVREALCDAACIEGCDAPATDSSPGIWEYFDDATNDALASCIEDAASCDDSSACLQDTPLAECFGD